jgi:AcrR family transcriptional regulator
MPVKRATAASPRVRLQPEARRQQILDVAARVLTEQGAARVEMMEVARLAGVTRPVVYRFFPTRLALVEGVLADFQRALAVRFQHALMSSMGKPVAEIAEAFIDAAADAIEDRGAGAWQLMYAKSSDLEAAQLGRAALGQLVTPWLPRVAELTGLALPRARLLVDIVVAAGGAALDGWLDGPLRRKDAVRIAAQAVSALLREFAPRP